MNTTKLKPWPDGVAPKPEASRDEAARKIALARYSLDALEDDPELAEITRFAAALCDAPLSLISLVEEERQRFLVRTGLEERETPRSESFCAHAMLEAEPMVVPDATLDERFSNFPSVLGDPKVRFYAGAPLISHEGVPLGSLCVIDVKRRPAGLTETQRQGMKVLASSVMRRLRHRRENLEQRTRFDERQQAIQVFADFIPDIAWSCTAEGMLDYCNKRWFDFSGEDRDANLLLSHKFVHPEDYAGFRESWTTALATGEPFEIECRLRRYDGTYRWMLSRGLPVKNDQAVERWFGTITDIDDARRRADERELLANELSHRIKNLFAVIGGLVRLKSRDYPGAVSFAEDVTNTLDTLGRAHRYITQDQPDTDETLHGLLGKLLAPYGDKAGSRLSVSGDDLPVHSKSATPFALVFHELATNCAKYGAFSVAEGSVSITTKQTGGRIAITWQEAGGPPPKAERGSGFGSRLVEATVGGQLDGQLTRTFGPEGIVAILDVPTVSL